MSVKPKNKLKRPGPVGGKRDENRRQKAKDLQAAALGLFLSQGIEGTTIDDIVERASVAKGSFYRYFADKDALVAGLFQPLREGLDEVFSRGEAALKAAKQPVDLLGVYQQLAFSTAALLFSHREEALLFLQESRAPAVGARRAVGELYELLRDQAVDLTLAARGHGFLRQLDPHVTSLAVLGASEALMFEYLKNGEGEPVSMAETLIDMILDGVRA